MDPRKPIYWEQEPCPYPSPPSRPWHLARDWKECSILGNTHLHPPAGCHRAGRLLRIFRFFIRFLLFFLACSGGFPVHGFDPPHARTRHSIACRPAPPFPAGFFARYQPYFPLPSYCLAAASTEFLRSGGVCNPVYPHFGVARFRMFTALHSLEVKRLRPTEF